MNRTHRTIVSAQEVLEDRRMLALSFSDFSLLGNELLGIQQSIAAAEFNEQRSTEGEIELQAGQEVSFFVEQDSELQPSVRILDRNGDSIFEQDAAAADSNVVANRVPVHETGRYRVVVDSPSESHGAISVSALTNATFELERSGQSTNDEPSTAQDLSLVARPVASSTESTLATVHGELSETDSIDMYSYRFDRRGSISLDAHSEPNDLKLQMYYSDGGLAMLGYETDEFDQYAPNFSGAVVVVVTGSSTEYTLSISEGMLIGDKSSDAWLDVNLLSELGGTLSYLDASEEHEFKFSGGIGRPPGPLIELTAKPLSSDFIPKILVTDGNGEQIAASKFSDGMARVLFHTNLVIRQLDPSFTVTISGQDNTSGRYLFSNPWLGLRNRPRVIDSRVDEVDGDAVMTVVASQNFSSFLNLDAVVTVRGRSSKQVELIDGRTGKFTLADTLQYGPNEIYLRGYENGVIDYYRGQIAPRVIFSSIRDGETRFAGRFWIQLTIDGQLDEASLHHGIANLVGEAQGPIEMQEWRYNAGNLTIGFGDVPPGEYTFTLIGGPDGIRDLHGNQLDGGSPFGNHLDGGSPFGKRGDGIPGGDYSTSFTLRPIVKQLERHSVHLRPVGLRVTGTSQMTRGTIDGAGARLYYLPRWPNELLTYVVKGIDGFQPKISLGDEVAMADAQGIATLSLPETSPFQHLKVEGIDGQFGDFEIDWISNASLDTQDTLGHGNDFLVDAFDLTYSRIEFDLGIHTSSVIGEVNSVDTSDWHRFRLNDGQYVTLTLASQSAISSDQLSLELYDSNQNLLSRGFLNTHQHQTSQFLAIEEYLDPTTDGQAQEYFVRVSSKSNAARAEKYLLSVIEDAGLGFHRQVDFRPLSVTGAHIGVDRTYYEFDAQAGDNVRIEASDSKWINPRATQFVDQDRNVLSPQPDFSDDGVEEASKLRTRVSFHSPSSAYVFRVSGLSRRQDFRVVAMEPANGSRFDQLPEKVSFQFDSIVDFTSLQVDALRFADIPATKLTIVSPQLIEFHVPRNLPEGPIDVRFSDGSIHDVNGLPLEGLAATYHLDNTPPTIVSTSIGEGQEVPSGRFAIDIEFSESVRDSFSMDHVQLSSRQDPDRFIPMSGRWNGNRLTVSAIFVPPGEYTLQLSGAEIKDRLEKQLDGNGDGIAGDDFVLRFKVVQNDFVDIDFNGDDSVDALDVDLLCRWVHEGEFDPQFDIDRDGKRLPEPAEFDFLIRELLGTTPGDADLDGDFDPADLVAVFIEGQYEDGIARNSGWASGDWNCDLEFNSADLVDAFVAGAWNANVGAKSDLETRHPFGSIGADIAASLLDRDSVGDDRDRKRVW